MLLHGRRAGASSACGRLKKIKKPEKTIQSLQDTASTLKRAASHPETATRA